MNNFIKTIISAVQNWTKKEIKKSTADWNEGDSNSSSYIKNRPFYDEKTEVVLLPEMAVSIEDDYGRITLSESFKMLTIGQDYYVTLNGVKYTCTARAYDGYVLIGNGTIYGDGDKGNNEPFSCDSYFDGTIYLNIGKAGKYTISISTKETKINKLDAKYLSIIENVPETVVSLENVRDTDVYEGPEYKKLVGRYKVYIDDQPKILEFVDHGDYSDIVEDNSYNIETWDGQIAFAFWDNLTADPHNVRITSIDTYEKINEKYLPDDIGTKIEKLSDLENDLFGEIPYKHITTIKKEDITITDSEYADGYVRIPRSLLGGLDADSLKFMVRGGYNNFDGEWEDISASSEDTYIEDRPSNGLIQKVYVLPNNGFYIYITVGGYRQGWDNLVVDEDIAEVYITSAYDPYYNGDFEIELYGDGIIKIDADYISDDIARVEDVERVETSINDRITHNSIYLTDISNGCVYQIQMKDGNLITNLCAEKTFIDFNTVENEDGTYTITGWKGTYQGEPSTELIVPDTDGLLKM